MKTLPGEILLGIRNRKLHEDLAGEQKNSPPGSTAEKSLAEFAPAGAKKMEIIFSGGVYVGENTARLANVRRARRALRALPRAAALSNESPVKRVSFESLSKTLF